MVVWKVWRWREWGVIQLREVVVLKQRRKEE
jgi:hypothetical protein